MDVREMAKEISSFKGAVDAVSKRLDDGFTQRDAEVGLIKKALSGGAPNGRTIASGWDGADLGHQILQIRSGGRRKTIGGGFGEFLQGVHHCSEGGMFNGQDTQKGRAILKKFKADRGEVTKAANAESTGATGGYLIPPQFIPKLFEIIAEESFFAAQCEHQAMTGLSMMYPALNQTNTVASGSAFPSSNFYGGVLNTWAPEASTLAATNPIFRQIQLEARTLASTTVVSNQLLMDSAIGIEAMVVDLLTKSLAWQLDYAFLRGTGVQMPLGAEVSPGTLSISGRSGSSFLLLNVAAMLARINMSSWKNLIWVMHQSVLPQLIQMTNGATNAPFLVWMNPAPNNNTNEGPAAQSFPLKLMGIPVYFTEKVPELGTAGDVLLCDASKYLCADRMQIQIESSIHPFFTTYQTVWRTVWRGDGTTMNDGAITLASGTTTVAPFVILT